MTRKRFTLGSLSSLVGLMTSGMSAAIALPRRSPTFSTADKRPLVLGSTFSQLQCRYMGLDYQEAFQQICTLGLDRIRLCTYWNEVEPTAQQFDFTALDWLLDRCHQHNIEVVLTVGMKAPRWPEFHFPEWLQAQQNTRQTGQPLDQNPAIADAALQFIDRVVIHTRHAPMLNYWQVENEPFTQLEIAAGRWLSQDFVQREVELLRSQILPHQKVVLTNAITLPSPHPTEDDRAFHISLALVDAVGINVYTKVTDGGTGYLEPSAAYWQTLKRWQHLLIQANKEDWIAEAQAEPWEAQKLVALDRVDYPSTSPRQMTTLVAQLKAIGYRTVMLWGCEYWYWHKRQGRNLWWWTIQKLLAG